VKAFDRLLEHQRYARASLRAGPQNRLEREFFIDNLLVRIHFIIVMIRWTSLAPWERLPAHQRYARASLRSVQFSIKNSYFAEM